MDSERKLSLLVISTLAAIPKQLAIVAMFFFFLLEIAYTLHNYYLFILFIINFIIGIDEILAWHTREIYYMVPWGQKYK